MRQDQATHSVTRINTPLRLELSDLIGLMLFITLIIGAIGYATFELHRQDIERSAQKNLASIADLKANQIAQWRKEQLADATALTENTKLITVFEHWLRAGMPAHADAQWMRSRLATIQRSRSYTSVILFDAEGEPRLSADDSAPPDSHIQQAVVQTVSAGQANLSDLHLSTRNKPEIDMFAPLINGRGEAARTVGVLYFRIDPARLLFPLIQSWPTESPTAETLLVRGEDDKARYLAPLRHRDDPALSLQLPVDDPMLPAAHAIKGETGFVNGKDYRGVPVVSYVRPIPDTNWAMVSKIDADELYAPVRQLAYWSGGITLLLLGACFAVFWLQMRRTQLSVSHQQLREERNLLHKRFEDLSKFANDIFLLMDEDNRIVEVNDRAISVYGYSRDELLQMRGVDLSAADSSAQHATHWDTILRQGHVNYETVHQCKSGQRIAIDVSARLLRLDHGKFVQFILRDITKRKEAEKRLHHLAYYDDLTGLPNRSLFISHLEQAISSAERHQKMVGVMLMDLDHFKNINDTLGHETGNALLQEVTQRLKTCFRQGDTVSRFGGDEFAVVLADMAHIEDATHIAQKILKAFEHPCCVNNYEIFTTFSIGISVYPFDDSNAHMLLRNADAAMYQAKSMGRGNFQFYSTELTWRTERRMALESGLRYALERQEFELHYQPQVDLKTGLVIGVEALVRWRPAGQGLVSPAEFIPVAEECGLIVPLGELILRTACAQAKAWQEQGFPQLIMAVNLSSRQFAHGHLVDTVKNILQETGLAPHCLELEITESVLIDGDDTNVLGALNELKRMGITLAIDDFGTGYSSLSYLKRFPIDKLKIDKAFVQGLPDNAEDAALIQAIIAMARSLQLTVIAEGVETEEQHDHLQHQDCDQIQGYFISRPLPGEQIGALLQATYRMKNSGSRNTQLPLQFTQDKPAP
jgi:diguanylate cyclase (GGDEF)-like protein/PAS domain S-box-containing protein